MLLQRSKLAAISLARPRLVPPWIVGLLVLLLVAALAALFPQQELVTRVLGTGYGDPLTAAYLRTLLRTDPDNPALRFMLAEQQLAARRYDDARAALAPLARAPDPGVRAETAARLWHISAREWEADGRPQAGRAALARALQALSEQHAWPETQELEFARKAYDLGDIGLALALYQRAGARRSDLGPDWYVQAAREAQGAGEYRAAAHLYLIARQRASGRAAQREHYFAAARALLAGNLPQEAAELAAASIGELADDREALIFVVELARAANRPDLADTWVRRLLQISLLEQLRTRLAAAGGFDARARPAALGAQAGPQLAFDDKAYRLGYEVFLANRKLEDAYHVAAAAVRARPADPEWRRRLAQTAEWTARPREALEHWLALARAGGEAQAWEAVLRLAPGLFDDRALVDALRARIGRGAASARQIEDIVAAYERLGEPEAALEFLTARAAEHGDAHTLTALAELAERHGEPERAATAWQHLIERHGVTPARAMRAAGWMLVQGRLAQALAMLERARALASADDADFWRRYGELARALQEDERAEDALRRVVDGPDAGADDWRALIDLLAAAYPERAAEVATRAWQKLGDAAFAERALYLHARAGQWPALLRLAGNLPPVVRAGFERGPEFLRLYAQALQHSGRAREAQAVLERALALAPADEAAAEALIWLTIDGNDAPALRRLLARGEARWRRQPALATALAAAWQALSEPRRALAYLEPQLPARRGDFLWLMNYADALEQDQQIERAWQLRAALLRQVRRAAVPAAVPAEVRALARVRLLLSQGGPQAALQPLRELLRADHEAAAPDPALSELVLAWLQQEQAYSAERGWLWQRYGATAVRPLWAQIAVALQHDESDEAATLLERHGERLPRYDAITTARRVGDLALAQTLAFAKQEDAQREDDPLHLQLADVLLAQHDRVRLSLRRARPGVLSEYARELSAEVGITPRLRLETALGSTQRRSRDATQLAAVPGSERSLRAALLWREDEGEIRLEYARRHGARRFDALRLAWQDRIARELTARAALGWRQPSADSAALRAAGWQDSAEAALTWQLSRRERIGASARVARFSGQTGTRFGSGSDITLEFAHRLRNEAPDLEAGLYAIDARRRRNAAQDPALSFLVPDGTAAGSALFVPESARLVGLRLSSDLPFRENYTRALRPFWSTALTHSSTLGRGYDLAFGLAGSLGGADHLALWWTSALGGTGAFNRTRELGFTYTLPF